MVSSSCRVAKTWELQAQETARQTVASTDSGLPCRKQLDPASQPQNPIPRQQNRENKLGAVALRHQGQRDPVRLRKHESLPEEALQQNEPDVWALGAGSQGDGSKERPTMEKLDELPYKRLPGVFLPKRKGWQGPPHSQGQVLAQQTYERLREKRDVDLMGDDKETLKRTGRPQRQLIRASGSSWTLD